MMRRVVLLVTFLLVCAGSASAQSGSDGWNVAIYPVFGWIPLDIDIKVDVPPFDNGTGGGSGSIVDGRFDGAFLGGFYASKGLFRVDGDGMWAAVGGDRPERLRVAAVTPGLLPMLEAVPLTGRLLADGDEKPGREPVILISHALWQQRFSGRADALNQTIRLNGTTYTIVGVMPPHFEFPDRATRAWAGWPGASCAARRPAGRGPPAARSRRGGSDPGCGGGGP